MNKSPDQMIRDLKRRWRAERASRLTWSDYFDRADDLGIPRMEAMWLKHHFTGANRDEDDIAGALEKLPALAERRREYVVRCRCRQTITVHDCIGFEYYTVDSRDVTQCPNCGRALGAGYLQAKDDVFSKLPDKLQKEILDMPINGLTTGRHKPQPRKRLGKFRKGSEKSPTAPGNDLEYFRFDEEHPGVAAAVEEIHGDEPNHIRVVFPYSAAGDNWMAYREEWNASQLVHRCDSTHLYDYNDLGELVKTDEKCPYADLDKEDKLCKPIGRLTVILPDLIPHGFYGFVTFETRSEHDISELDNEIYYYEGKFNGDLSAENGGVFVISRGPREVGVTFGGKKRRQIKSLMYITPEREFIQKKYQHVLSAPAGEKAPALPSTADDAASNDAAGDNPAWPEANGRESDTVDGEFRTADDAAPSTTGEAVPESQPAADTDTVTHAGVPDDITWTDYWQMAADLGIDKEAAIAIQEDAGGALRESYKLLVERAG